MEIFFFEFKHIVLDTTQTDIINTVNMFVNVYTHQEFCDRYNTVLNDLAIEQDRSPTSKCQAVAMILNWTSTDYMLDQTKVKNIKMKHA